jgi:hypothetical protein
MAAVRCPMCGKVNPPELEECQFCGARIKPILSSTPVNFKSIQAGENPINRDTSEFEKVKSPRAASIHPGEVPTKKNTAELEKALPSWLRSLRDGKNSAENTSQADTASDENPSVLPDATHARKHPEPCPIGFSALKNLHLKTKKCLTGWPACEAISRPNLPTCLTRKGNRPPKWATRIGWRVWAVSRKLRPLQAWSVNRLHP